MKVLILSCNTGQGHNTAGNAMREFLEDQGIACEMKDALSFASEQVSRVVSNSYINIATKAPRFFQFLYWAGSGISSSKVKSVVYLANKQYAASLGAYINENGFDVVLLPHLFPAEAITSLRRKHAIHARCYGIATDYTCSPFWEETELDGYFIPHQDLKEEFVGRGIPEEKLIVTGIPVSKRFTRVVDREMLREKFSVPKNGKMLVVMSGSMGFGAVEALAQQLCDQTTPFDRIVVMGGTNESLKASLRKTFAQESRVKILDFTRGVDEYMAACDVLFTKPGGLTSTEAAARQVPLVHTAQIPGCETINAAFFKAHGLSLCAANEKEAASCGALLCSQKKMQEEMKQAQRQTIHGDAAARIFAHLRNEMR